MGAFWVVAILSMVAVGRGEEGSSGGVRRDDFPEDFVFGSGTSAYQVEGAAAEDGRTPSIWDTFARNGKAHAVGDIASNQYHKYKEDVKLMEETGLEGYRFSVSWSRLIPNGRGEINPKGLEYYNNLINELISHGIEPHVTIFHFDLPQVLEDEYGGWLSLKIVDDFTAYADVLFREFGDRVSHWTTLNEPNVFALGGYGQGGIMPPGRCSPPFGNCSSGNSILEPYIAAHHLLLAHSSAVSLYRRKYQAEQKGFIGLNLIVFHLLPISNLTKDISATKRTQDFYTGWFLEPLTHGDYPETMRKATGKKMPNFSWSQSRQLIGSFDFIGVNYYYRFYVEDNPIDAPADQRNFFGDMSATITFGSDGMASIEKSMTPSGLIGVLEYFKQAYGNPPIYIHENGYPMQHNDLFDDSPRVKHLSEHLGGLRDALRNGSNARGYFTWSFVDVFELFFGYKATYGLCYVDFNDADRKRSPRLSARWYSNFLKRRENFNIISKRSSHVSQGKFPFVM